MRLVLAGLRRPSAAAGRKKEQVVSLRRDALLSVVDGSYGLLPRRLEPSKPEGDGVVWLSTVDYLGGRSILHLRRRSRRRLGGGVLPARPMVIGT